MSFKEAMKCTCTSAYNAIREEHNVSREHHQQKEEDEKRLNINRVLGLSSITFCT
jgi:hypothetical protein